MIIVVVTISSATRTMASRPDIISRGFVYVREAETLMEGIREIAAESVRVSLNGKGHLEWAVVKSSLKSNVARYIYDQTKRNPMILPIIEEV